MKENVKKQIKKFFLLSFGALLLSACSYLPWATEQRDSFLWLEEIEGDKALSWVKEQNKNTLNELTQGKRFKNLEDSALEILEAKDKIPWIALKGSHVYNFWQDDQSIRGVWRKTSVKNYKKKKPNWEILLDIDALAKKEKENWVYHGSQCLPPQWRYCLIYFSRGGKDASVVREFDTAKKKFVKNGFYLPEAKNSVTWMDKDHLLVGTNFGPGSLTDSGHPRILKLWKRGTDIKQAHFILKGKKSDVSLYSQRLMNSQEQALVIARKDSFFTGFYWLYEKGVLKKLPLQKTAQISNFFHGFFIVHLKKDWLVEDQTFLQGSLVAVDKQVAGQPHVSKNQVHILYMPGKKSTIEYTYMTKNRLLVRTLDNIKGRLFQVTLDKPRNSKEKLSENTPSRKSFKVQPMNLIPGAHLRSVTTSFDSSDFFVLREDFLNPDTLYLYSNKRNKVSKVKSLPHRFKNKNMIVLQKWATSQDGTQIPYFLVGQKSQIKKGQAPTLLNGYGGFEISFTPFYSGLLGRTWLEKGGIYVLANIRGGGEFGPQWHQAAKKMNRHKAYDDFIAVAEDLIKKGITTKDKLAIKGGSNGGLLVGAVMTRRPDLFKAVICQVPLLDMIRYSQLLAGASWVGEYGDPKKKKERQYLLSYSPYHKVKPRKDQKYPDLFLMTSTKDDRVHPGHARKMAAKMFHLGHTNLQYYENIEGGHGAAANLKQKAKMKALTFEFLFKTFQM